ncbi:MAG: Holliday junction resolvase RuvX [Planctomycetes bacterium]|nr:Holliday junction resolvase RuvX [Planctomycetota bacterium]
MRTLAIDYGEKRIGLALADTHGIPLALPVLLRSTPERDLGALAQLVEDRRIGDVVVGMPLNMSGTVGPRARATLEFMDTLRAALAIPVHSFDERLTSVQATGMLAGSGLSRKHKRSHVNTVAAQLILGGYLEARARAEARAAANERARIEREGEQVEEADEAASGPDAPWPEEKSDAT